MGFTGFLSGKKQEIGRRDFFGPNRLTIRRLTTDFYVNAATTPLQKRKKKIKKKKKKGRKGKG